MPHEAPIDESFPNGDVVPWPADPDALFPDAGDCFWYPALERSRNEGLESFGWNAILEWLFSPDGLDENWHYLLDQAARLYPETFQQRIRFAIDALRFELQPTDEDWKPTPEAWRILEVLDKSPTTLTAIQIQAALDDEDGGCDSLPLARKTVGLYCQRLRELGFIVYPAGPRKGATITESGRALLASRPTH